MTCMADDYFYYSNLYICIEIIKTFFLFYFLVISIYISSSWLQKQAYINRLNTSATFKFNTER